MHSIMDRSAFVDNRIGHTVQSWRLEAGQVYRGRRV